MFHDINQGQTDKPVIGVSAGSVEMIGIDKGVAAFGGSALIREFFKTMSVPGDGRVKSGVGIGVDVDHRSEGTVGGAIRFNRTLIRMNDVERSAVSVGITFNRAVIEMGVFSLAEQVVAHPETLRAKGSAIGIQPDIFVIEEMGEDLFAVAGERDNGDNAFSPKVRIVGVGVVMAVAAKDGDVHEGANNHSPVLSMMVSSFW